MEAALVAVTAHAVEDASLIVVHVCTSTAAAHHAALGARLRELVDRAPAASVVIVHGNGEEAHHEPTRAMYDDITRHARTRGVFVRCT